ncbi:DEAD/DEAH box helicase family protein [Bacillus inaquosorum]|uniref:DEAD/DEAH box helicase family protein n=1 Tax=Bacillus inaquosorum TaxID=483913 RepID=UPI00227DFDA9|nr:DEAD/DEAH box helicase family protein [Bacillus inaquosorum]MCY7949369.1 DEAD/DEAH box helicase family protein [Bacillus inaquosorum]MEC0520502.1 DEAD/DEAH box helicase family protein [Bacillus inaquosorum]MEC0607305.1 DEAD/DEAH box helicase family protein [Bacillus inaquosorum]
MTELPNIPLTLNTSDNNFSLEFYDPCLKWANKYDRGVGYFTSSWIRSNAYGLSNFAANGGTARWITSPIIDERDLDALSKGLIEPEDIDLVSTLKEEVRLLQEYLEEETLNAIAWFIYDGILEFRFVVPTKSLEGGDFHDKFGIFYGAEEKLSFNGSVNDSKKGERNYESIKVFPTWKGLGDFVEDDIKRFEKIWNNSDENLKVFDLPSAVKEDIFTLRTLERPYKLLEEKRIENKWRHQDDAISNFLNIGNGILEMATGTGKTRTALSIVKILHNNKSVKSAIVTVDGSDLLEQWSKEVVMWTNLTIYKQFSRYKEASGFLLNPDNAVLIISREFLVDFIDHFTNQILTNSIIICDEVHGFGAPMLVKKLSGKISPFKYRLGLSATPEREYDENGNDFIEAEIGGKVFEFGLEDAIRRGILCEFDYNPLEFELTEEDRKKIKQLIATHNAKKQAGEYVLDENLFRDIARVKKVSKAKLPIFYSFLQSNRDILDRSIIFVETKEFGEVVQQILIRFEPNYHTYYGEDDRQNLLRFSNGELNCLITSKRISEGIDISSVNNIILFSADRAKIQTIQRIGRSLRLDPNNPKKRAAVVDFIQVSDEGNSDHDRRIWLNEMAKVKREE